jgi:hypothetical protein
MKDILMEIIEAKRNTICEQKKAISLAALQDGAVEERNMLSMRQALANSSSGIIAEFKRKVAFKRMDK